MQIGSLISAMHAYFAGDAKRIQHFLKVYALAKTIGEGEGLSKETQYILEVAAVTHDIGIRESERKFGSCNGKLQEQEGPAEAKKLLELLGENAQVIARVQWLIAHHHTVLDIPDLDYRALIEADFLVNAYEDALSDTAISAGERSIFRTETGKRLLHSMFASAF